MKICCPKCKEQVPTDQVDIGADQAYCLGCDEGFAISEYIVGRKLDLAIQDNEVGGTWVREEAGDVIVGGALRNWGALLFLVPFTLVWGWMSIGDFTGQRWRGGDILVNGVFRFASIASSLAVIGMCLMFLFGKVEVRIGVKSKVFVGLWRLGWTRKFDWNEIELITDKYVRKENDDRGWWMIILKGMREIKFGSMLPEKRRKYIFNVLLKLKHGKEG